MSSSDRLTRLLALVPYVISRTSVSVAEAAAAFEVTEKQLIDDLNLLWCVELRAPDPYCPIDLSYEGGEIVVSEAESISRPLRLDVDEASALLVALRTLAEIPGRGDALSRVLAKLEAAAGSAARPSSQVSVQVDVRPDVLVRVRAGLDEGRRLRMTYYVPGRDENTERDVDPMRLLLVDGWSYLEGWCRKAEAVRLFRLDRIVELAVLDVAASIPEDAEPVDVDRGLFRPSPDDIRVILELTPSGRLGRRPLPVRERHRAGGGAAARRAAHPRHPLGTPPGAAAGRLRRGHGPGRARRRGARRRRAGARALRLGLPCSLGVCRG